jgi:NAD(P)-dependent dehydrogenase (short-subunit alcohol dehydrogenase family)
MSRRTHGASAVVTGAGSGIGRAFAHEIARRGGRVVCADIDLAAAKATAAAVSAQGVGAAHPVACDVSDLDQVRDLAEAARLWLDGPVDLVVNNAGIATGGGYVEDTSTADWRRTLEINLWGVIHGCQVFTPGLRALGRGGVINVASAAAFAAAPRMGAYNVSKAGVLSLSETMAAELSGTGVRVTVLCPTFVRTNLVNAGRVDDAAAKLANDLMAWVGFSPERVAAMTLDAHDRGRLYVLPQFDARLVWAAKRMLPTVYTYGAGLIGRLLPASAPVAEPAPVAVVSEGVPS